MQSIVSNYWQTPKICLKVDAISGQQKASTAKRIDIFQCEQSRSNRVQLEQSIPLLLNSDAAK
jgi:hypothetical protein